MNNTVQIACRINTTDVLSQLGLTIKLNDDIIFNSEHINGPVDFAHELNDDDGEHLLEFIMKNKTDKDTKIDVEGNIVKDASLIISDLAFDELELKHVFVEHAVYSHNFNGSGKNVQDKFYGEMGCTGTVSLKFTTPIYMWLLENM